MGLGSEFKCLGPTRGSRMFQVCFEGSRIIIDEMTDIRNGEAVILKRWRTV